MDITNITPEEYSKLLHEVQSNFYTGLSKPLAAILPPISTDYSGTAKSNMIQTASGLISSQELSQTVIQANNLKNLFDVAKLSDFIQLLAIASQQDDAFSLADSFTYSVALGDTMLDASTWDINEWS